MRLRLKKGIELGILMDALLVYHRDKDKHHLIPDVKNKIAKRLEDAGLSVEETENFIRTIEIWVKRITEKEL